MKENEKGKKEEKNRREDRIVPRRKKRKKKRAARRTPARRVKQAERSEEQADERGLGNGGNEHAARRRVERRRPPRTVVDLNRGELALDAVRRAGIAGVRHGNDLHGRRALVFEQFRKQRVGDVQLKRAAQRQRAVPAQRDRRRIRGRNFDGESVHGQARAVFERNRAPAGKFEVGNGLRKRRAVEFQIRAGRKRDFDVPAQRAVRDRSAGNGERHRDVRVPAEIERAAGNQRNCARRPRERIVGRFRAGFVLAEIERSRDFNRAVALDRPVQVHRSRALDAQRARAERVMPGAVVGVFSVRMHVRRQRSRDDRVARVGIVDVHRQRRARVHRQASRAGYRPVFRSRSDRIVPTQRLENVISAFDDDVVRIHISVNDDGPFVLLRENNASRPVVLRRLSAEMHFAAAPPLILVNVVSPIVFVLVERRMIHAAVVIKRFGRIAERGKRKRRGKRGEREALFRCSRGDAEAVGNHEFPFTEWGGGTKTVLPEVFSRSDIFIAHTK